MRRIRLVRILIVRVIPNNVLEKPELLSHGVVNPGLNSAHDLERALQNSQRRTHRRLGGHVTDFEVGCTGEATAFFDDCAQQTVQHLTWLLVREGHDVVFNGPRGYINVSKFCRSDWRIVSLNT